MKKNVKKVVKARCDQLFAQFLSGEIRDGAAINSGEQPYSISGKPVRVAHPMEMTACRFKGQEKHGIPFDFNYGVSELDISFSGCNLEYDLRGGAAAFLGPERFDDPGQVHL